jgi:hypothetical protein
MEIRRAEKGKRKVQANTPVQLKSILSLLRKEAL